MATKTNLPKIVPVEENLRKNVMKYFLEERIGYVNAGEKKWFLPGKYEQEAGKLLNFELRDDDVWIMGYPRSGTTVTQELAWLLVNDLDFEKAKTDIAIRVPLIEGNILFDERNVEEFYTNHPDRKESTKVLMDAFLYTIPNLNKMKTRRVMKTHLGFELLPPDLLERNKVIYICRNPKDAAVSYFHLQSNLITRSYKGDFKTYWKFFMNDNCLFCPYFEHVAQGYAKKDHPNVLFVFYEDLRKDLRHTIELMSDFLNKPLSENQVQDLMKYLDIESFKSKNNEAQMVNTKNGQNSTFIRQGKVGGWTKYFTEEMTKEADEWIKKETAKIGFDYPI